MSWFNHKNIGDRRDIIAELLVLDEYCIENNVYTEFIIVGGALLVITLEEKGLQYRMTSDIDIARITSNDEKSLNDILFNDLQERINTRVESIITPDVNELVEIGEVEEFHQELFENIKPFTATPEMLVVLKSISDRSIDMDDIFKSGILGIVNIEKTIKLIKEYKSYSPFSDLPDAHWSEVIDELKKRL